MAIVQNTAPWTFLGDRAINAVPGGVLRHAGWT